MNTSFKYMAFKSLKQSLVLASLILLGACASNTTRTASEPWMHEVLNYENSLPVNHKDSVDNLYKVSPQIAALIRTKFGRLPEHRAARKLAMWLVDKKGKGMKYDIESNLTPVETFRQNRGNCLSFTLLLVQLADELGIRLNINEVDLPNTWGQNEEKDLIFYRHVNAIYESSLQTQIFDLALEEYGYGYPQRFISKRQGAALLYSNIGIQHLQNQDLDQAIHYLKLAVSISPKNSDLWINLGVALNRTNRSIHAEQAYLYAVALNDKDSIAASNLERLYRAQSRYSLAEKFKKRAHKARQKNPYVHFQKASDAFETGDFHIAKKSIKRAIRLYDKDPQFFELRSKLKQVEEKYVAALRDLEKAHNLSSQNEERARYAGKVNFILAKAKQQIEEQRLRLEQHSRNVNVNRLPNSNPL